MTMALGYCVWYSDGSTWRPSMMVDLPSFRHLEMSPWMPLRAILASIW